MYEEMKKALNECAKQLAYMAAQLPSEEEGEWVGRPKHRRCSECGFTAWYDFTLDYELTSRYCPNCGTRMKGEQE